VSQEQQQAEPHADNDRRMLRHWQEWEVTGREIRSVFCVATRIELRPGMPGFDEGALQTLIAEAQAMMSAGDSAMDLLRIVPED
jgi:hypothetical protein